MGKDATKKRPRGRPARPERQSRGNLTIRIRNQVRDDLETAAASSGRSLSEEIEHRVELTLARKDYLVDLWGRDVFNIAESMWKALAYIERFEAEGERWTTSDKAAEVFQRTASLLVQNYRSLVNGQPREVDRGPSRFEDKTVEQLAETFAALGGISPPYPREPAGHGDTP